jgi:prolyl-tRNA synthetase
MRVSQYFIPTRKEDPKEAEIPSHKMMLRAGLIRQNLAGVYSLLPMGFKVIRNVMRVIREEMEAIGSQEFHLPALSGADLWEKSGRWDTFGDDMFRLRDRKGRELCLSPTHEEVFAEIAAAELHSYRDVPQMWYQIQPKFRDEVRPRSGLLRVRQFFMKDAYSFDISSEGLDNSYALQRAAYLKIFERCGLEVAVVAASSGAMGGRDCEEFMVLSDSGDDEIVHCPSCGYAANQEVAASAVASVSTEPGEIEKVHTPDARTIKDVSGFLNVEPARLVKSLVYALAEGYAFVLVRGDHQVDAGKLEVALGECRPAEPDEIWKLTGAKVGFVSPYGIAGVTVIADPELEGMSGMIAGANENDHHLTGVNVGRDLHVDRFVPLRAVSAGEPCIKCGEPLTVARGIEVGHIFKLGTRYSEAFGANLLDENGDEKPVIMGSYGIGVERIMASAIERYFDGNSMVWPREIAPFLVEVLPLNVNSEPVAAAADELYGALCDAGISALMDDRDDRAGVKFKDSDLFGAPIVVVIGDRGLREGAMEVRIRDRDESLSVAPDALVETVMKAVNSGELS